MAVEIVRIFTYMDGWLTADLTYDTDDLNEDPDLVWWRVECHSPVALWVRIWRGGNPNPWREAVMVDTDVFEGGPAGPVKKILDLGRWSVGEG